MAGLLTTNPTAEIMHTCPTCKAQNKIVNQCRCDLNNLPTPLINQPTEHGGETGFWCQGVSVFIADTANPAQAVANYRKRLAEGNIAVQHSGK